MLEEFLDGSKTRMKAVGKNGPGMGDGGNVVLVTEHPPALCFLDLADIGVLYELQFFRLVGGPE